MKYNIGRIESGQIYKKNSNSTKIAIYNLKTRK